MRSTIQGCNREYNLKSSRRWLHRCNCEVSARSAELQNPSFTHLVSRTLGTLTWQTAQKPDQFALTPSSGLVHHALNLGANCLVAHADHFCYLGQGLAIQKDERKASLGRGQPVQPTQDLRWQS